MASSAAQVAGTAAQAFEDRTAARGEGVVIARGRKAADDLWFLNETEAFFRLETNYDHFNPVPEADDRRTPGNAHMRQLGRGGVGEDGILGVMKAWPEVVDAPFSEASKMLSLTAEQLLEPFSLLAILIAALLIILIANWMNQKSKSDPASCDAWLVSSAALTTTLWVDGLFFATTLIQPQLSGLI